jgi:hypothetical protein
LKRVRFSWTGLAGIFTKRIDGKRWCNWFIEIPPYPNRYGLRLQVHLGAFGFLIFGRVGCPWCAHCPTPDLCTRI